MLLIFPMFDDFPEMPEKDVEVSRNLIRLLIDFGKQDGSPIKDWEKLDLNDPNYLVIDSENFRVEKGSMPQQERIDFWNSLPPVYWKFSSRGPAHPKDEL